MTELLIGGLVGFVSGFSVCWIWAMLRVTGLVREAIAEQRTTRSRRVHL